MKTSDLFNISVVTYIRSGDIVTIRFVLPEPGSWAALEQSDAWTQFQRTVKEMQKGGLTP